MDQELFASLDDYTDIPGAPNSAEFVYLDPAPI